jgi:hypothetical protein
MEGSGFKNSGQMFNVEIKGEDSSLGIEGDGSGFGVEGLGIRQ